MNLDPGCGAMTGFPEAGRVNGPICHGAWVCAAKAEAHMNIKVRTALGKTLERLTIVILLLLRSVE
jgi:hypothetical protein